MIRSLSLSQGARTYPRSGYFLVYTGIWLKVIEQVGHFDQLITFAMVRNLTTYCYDIFHLSNNGKLAVGCFCTLVDFDIVLNRHQKIFEHAHLDAKIYLIMLGTS